MSTCMRCGKEIADGSSLCNDCKTVVNPAENVQPTYVQQYQQANPVQPNPAQQQYAPPPPPQQPNMSYQQPNMNYQQPYQQPGMNYQQPYQQQPNVGYQQTEQPKKNNKKGIAIIIAVSVISIIAVAILIFMPSKFERVKDKCVDIAGMVSGSAYDDSYFVIDTRREEFEGLGSSYLNEMSGRALEAIQYANKEFGFSDSVYSQMLNTSALAGVQSVENDKYRVSWTYHPDDGLEVTYKEK